MISIISIFNNRSLLEKYLIKSLERQSIKYELVLIDNSDNKFSSASEAFNYFGNKVKGVYLIFIHQDFEFDSSNWLEVSIELLDNLKNLGIAGVAGRYGRKTISNIRTGTPPKYAGPIQIEEPEKVQTLDECLFIIPQEIFKKFKFDEKTCDNWHLYASDYCLTVKKAGYDAYVLPLGGYHASPGYSFTPEAYYSTLRKLLKKHKADYRWIYTTTGSWSTVYPLFMQIFYQKLYYWLGLHRRNRLLC